MTTTPTSGAADLRDTLINIAREIEALKRECGMDPESPIAIQNGRYMALSYKVRALAAGQATAAKQPDSENLRKALQFYADSEHFIKSDGDAWDTVSDEPQNYWCDEAGTATVEDGHIARLALSGHPVRFEDDTAQPAAQPGATYAELSEERAAFERWNKDANQGYDLAPCTSGKLQTFESTETEHAWRGFFHGLRAAHGQAPAGAYKDSTPDLHVVDSSFESWYADYVKEGTKGLKQHCRDAYAAGMVDPLVMAAPAAVETDPCPGCIPCGYCRTPKCGRLIAMNAAKNSAPAAVAGPKKWAPEELEDGERGIRWVTNEGIHGRPTDHDVREYLKRTPTANGCLCDECKAFYAAAPTTQPAPQPVEREPLTPEQMDAALGSAKKVKPGYVGWVTDQRRELGRAVERAHGIKGGQHGNE